MYGYQLASDNHDCNGTYVLHVTVVISIIIPCYFRYNGMHDGWSQLLTNMCGAGGFI